MKTQMNALSVYRSALLLLAVLLTLSSGCMNGCSPGGGTAAVPKPGDPLYAKMVSAFYSGTIALETDTKEKSNEQLLKATQLVPGEPASWANLSLSRLRGGDVPGARQALDRALSLLPNGNSQIEALQAALEGRAGNAAGELSHLQKAIQLDPNNLRARYSLATRLRQQIGTVDEKQVQEQLIAILKVKPHNLAALTDLAVSAAHSNDAGLLKQAIQGIESGAATFPPNVSEQFKPLQQAASNPSQAIGPATLLQNVLKPTEGYKQDIAELNIGVKAIGDPIDRFLVMESPPSTPSPPDTALSFTPQPIPGVKKADFVTTITLAAELPQFVASGHQLPTATEKAPATLWGNAYSVTVIGPDSKESVLYSSLTSNRKTQIAPANVVSCDLNFDFRPDLVIAEDGVRIYQQTLQGGFSDVTAKAKLPASISGGRYRGVWPLDIEDDGDLDLLLAPVKGPPVVLQNNGDGTWQPMNSFSGIGSLRAFAWADFDGDGDDDAAMLDDQGALHLFENLRGGHYRPWVGPPNMGKLLALSVADVTRRGTLDLVALKDDGSIIRVGRKADGTWETGEVARWTNPPTDGSARLLWADLDNNGSLDLIATGSQGTTIWLGDAQSKLVQLNGLPDIRNAAVDNASLNPLLDLTGVTPAGEAVRLVNHSTRKYHWQSIRPRADFVNLNKDQSGIGSGRINTFGVGGEVEIRAGLLYEKMPITGPSVHFGLGDYSQADAARLFWPNGTNSAEFPPDIPADQFVVAKQRLDTSCPWLFAWDGSRMKMVTDCIWKSPLGLKINSQVSPAVSQTEDWIKIRGDQLVPHDGYYDLRICAELWETHFFDYLELVAVDHPEGTDIFTDERFVPKDSQPLAINLMTPPVPVSLAVDDLGNNVTDIVKARDERFLDTFGRAQYQGVTRDHFVEVEIGSDAPIDQPMFLVCNAWIHPTDSSINVAISQGKHDPPRGLSLEIPDGHGHWVTAKPNLGFPEGKVKNMLIDITGLFKNKPAPHRLRLRTNLEIYWDFIGWAKKLRPDGMKLTTIPLQSADLHYRGFSVTHTKDASSPEMADYSLEGTAQRWYDLEGFYTRYGEVSPLLKAVDDHYMIMNAGDELSMRFPEVPLPPTGWKRDYVLKGDGWVKDGNFNTTFSKTILPLPSHKDNRYSTPPTTLEADPVYRANQKDWEEYHTRYVSPADLRRAMLPKATP